MQINTSTHAVTPQPDITLPKPKQILTYSANITQIATDDPTVTLLQNDLPEPIIWTRNNVGIYWGTTQAPLFARDTHIQITAQNTGNGGLILQTQVVDEFTIELRTYVGGSSTDALLNNSPLKVQIYQNTTITGNTPIIPTPQPYKIYTALLNQSGTNAPTAIPLQNTIGDIVWTRSDVGTYTATLTNAFTNNKTAILTNADTNGIINNAVSLDEDTINLTVGEYIAGTYTPEDGIMGQTTIEIRVYN